MPVAGVQRAVCPGVGSETLLFAILILAFVLGAFGPDLDALSTLQVILPMAFVFGTILVLVLAVSIAFVGPPLTFICVAIFMEEGTFATSIAFLPHALIDSAIAPSHFALAMSETTSHLSLVDRARTLIIDSFHYQWCVWVIDLPGLERLQHFLVLEVKRVLQLHICLEPFVPPSFQKAADQRLHTDYHFHLVSLALPVLRAGLLDITRVVAERTTLL